jgi:hypothetical protein
MIRKTTIMVYALRYLDGTVKVYFMYFNIVSPAISDSRSEENFYSGRL